MHPVVSGAIARIISFVPTAVASVIAARLILAHYGVPAFNAFTIAESLIVLVPLNDLGVGGAITVAFATDDPLREDSQRVVLTSARVMAVSTIALVILALLMSATGAWPALLGRASYAGGFYGLLMICYAASFVPGLSVAMLLGVHRAHLTILVQSLMMPLACAGLVVLIAAGASGRWVVALPGAAVAAVSLLTCIVSTRVIRFSWSSMLRKVPFPKRYPGGSIRGIAGPRLALSLLTPLQLATDRVVLSHFSTPTQVADYGVAMQIFAPATALIAAAAGPLWPIFLAARAKGEVGPRMARILMAFIGGTVLLCAVLVPISGPVGDVVGDGKVHLGILLPISGAILSLVGSVVFPLVMAFTSPRDLRAAAWSAATVLPVNLVVSSVLAAHIGAPGPLLGTALVGAVECAWALWYLQTRVWSQSGSPQEDPPGVGSGVEAGGWSP